MKLKELEGHLRQHGCEFHRQGGVHAIWISSMNGKIATVPRHREIKENTARAICKLEVPLP